MFNGFYLVEQKSFNYTLEIMINKKILTLLIVVLLSVTGSAQYQNAKLLSKFGVAGGFEVFYLNPDLNALNTQMQLCGLPEFSKNGFVTYGGSGYAYVMFIRNLRIGGVGFGGASSVSTNAGGNYKSAEYSISGGGITLEYTFPQIESIQLSLGAIVGFGKAEINLINRNGSFSWDSIWNDFNTTSDNKTINLSSKFFILSPTVNAEILLGRFTALRIGAGYQFTVGNNWMVFGDQSLSNVPNSLNGNSFFINAGVMFGLFVF